jgi:hypothetical protein
MGLVVLFKSIFSCHGWIAFRLGVKGNLRSSESAVEEEGVNSQDECKDTKGPGKSNSNLVATARGDSQALGDSFHAWQDGGDKVASRGVLVVDLKVGFALASHLVHVLAELNHVGVVILVVVVVVVVALLEK